MYHFYCQTSATYNALASELGEDLTSQASHEGGQEQVQDLLSDLRATKIRRSLKRLSGTIPQMQQLLMTKEKEQLARSFETDLDKQLSKLGVQALKPLTTIEGAQDFIKQYFARRNRSITTSAINALASFVVENGEVVGGGLEFMLTGWDLRGDCNVNEVKDVLNTMKEVSAKQSVIRNSFKQEGNTILTVLKTSVQQLINQLEKVNMTTEVPIPKVVVRPDIPSSSTLQARKTSNIVIGKEIKEITGTLEEKLVRMLEKMNLDGPKLQAFKKPGRNLLNDLTEFATKMKANHWDMLDSSTGRSDMVNLLLSFLEGTMNVKLIKEGL